MPGGDWGTPRRPAAGALKGSCPPPPRQPPAPHTLVHATVHGGSAEANDSDDSGVWMPQLCWLRRPERLPPRLVAATWPGR